MSDRNKWNHSQACDSCKQRNAEASTCNHYRGGKTAFERANGTTAQRLSNQAQRSAWSQGTPGRRGAFPAGTCNGHRNKAAK
jgi:hypothetical protein